MPPTTAFDNVQSSKPVEEASSPKEDEVNRASARRKSWQDEGIERLLDNNKRWAAQTITRDPSFFQRLKDQQAPEYFWIGCADSRVPANQIVDLAPGEVFVQRNVGNQASHNDLNCMACLEYSVGALGVRHIIVSGHYNCGAVRAALIMKQSSDALVNLWVKAIRDVRDEHHEELQKLSTQQERVNRLCELNVVRQVFNVCTSPTVQSAWEKCQPLAVHGIIYSVETGLITELHPPINSLDELVAFTRKYEKLHAFHVRVRNNNSFSRHNSAELAHA